MTENLDSGGRGERRRRREAQRAQDTQHEPEALSRRELRARAEALATGELVVEPQTGEIHLGRPIEAVPVLDEPPTDTGLTRRQRRELERAATGAIPVPESAPEPVSEPVAIISSPVEVTTAPAEPAADVAPAETESAPERDEASGSESVEESGPRSGQGHPSLGTAAFGAPARAASTVASRPQPADEDMEELESTVAAPPPWQGQPAVQPPAAPPAPERVSATEPRPGPAEPEAPAERTASRPVVRPPSGAATRSVDETGELTEIQAPGAPQRRSVFTAQAPRAPHEEASDGPATETMSPAGWSSAVDLPVVTGVVPITVPPTVPVAKPAAEAAEPSGTEEPDTEAPAEKPDAEVHDLQPSWNAVVSGTSPASPASEAGPDLAEEFKAEHPSPRWLTWLQGIVVLAVALVLGMLIWYLWSNHGPGATDGAPAVASLVSTPLTL